MENQRRVNGGRLWKVFAFAGVLIVCLAVRFDFYYDLNDDTAIKDILSGTYTGTPSGYCIQMLYPLGGLIACAYRAIHKVPWYGLFLCLCQFGVLTLVAWRLVTVVKKGWVQFILLLLEGLLALGLSGRELVIVQYSVTSGMCMAGAVFLFLTGDNKPKPAEYVRANGIPILLVLLSFMIRTEMCLMLLPFLLLAGMGRWAEEEHIFTGTNIRKYTMVIGTALLGMLVLFSLDCFAYRSVEWKSFRSFFDARTQLYDFYGIPEYEQNREFYESIGLSEESYELLLNYNFAIDDSIDEQMLSQIAAYQKELAGQEGELCRTGSFVSRKSLKEAVWRYKEHLLSLEDGVTGCLVLAAYLLYFLLASGRKRSGCYWKLVLLLVIRSILWLYLYMVDRVLPRITCPLLMTEFVLLAGWMVQEVRMDRQLDRKGLYHMKTAGVISLLAVCGLASTVTNMKETRAEYELRETANERWEALKTYCHERGQAFYIIDVYSSTSYQGTPYSEKLFADTDYQYRNFDLCGGWVAKSPLAKEKLAKADIKDLEQALCQSSREENGNEVFFVAAVDTDVSWLTDYYEHRGQKVQPVCIDEITMSDGTPIFDVYRLQ